MNVRGKNLIKGFFYFKLPHHLHYHHHNHNNISKCGNLSKQTSNGLKSQIVVRNEKTSKNSSPIASQAKSFQNVPPDDVNARGESSNFQNIKKNKSSKSKKSMQSHQRSCSQQPSSISTRLKHRFKSTESLSLYYRNHLSNHLLASRNRSKYSNQPPLSSTPINSYVTNQEKEKSSRGITSR